MYVSVRYWNPMANAYASSPFTYMTNMELVAGDVVLAPTAKQPAGARAIVVETHLPAPSFRCKEITERYNPEEG